MTPKRCDLRAARERSSVRIHRMPSGSSPLTGSSRIRMAGSPSRAEAMPRRCPIPRENPPARLLATLVRPTISRTSSTRLSADPIRQGQTAEVVDGAAPGVERLGVQQGPDLVEGLAVLRERSPVDQRAPGRGIVETEDHAQGCGLASAVRAEKPGDPAGMDIEAEVVHGNGVAIALGQTVYLDTRCAGGHHVCPFGLEAADGHFWISALVDLVAPIHPRWVWPKWSSYLRPYPISRSIPI